MNSALHLPVTIGDEGLEKLHSDILQAIEPVLGTCEKFHLRLKTNSFLKKSQDVDKKRLFSLRGKSKNQTLSELFRPFTDVASGFSPFFQELATRLELASNGKKHGLYEGLPPQIVTDFLIRPEEEREETYSEVRQWLWDMQKPAQGYTGYYSSVGRVLDKRLAQLQPSSLLKLRDFLEGKEIKIGETEEPESNPVGYIEVEPTIVYARFHDPNQVNIIGDLTYSEIVYTVYKSDQSSTSAKVPHPSKFHICQSSTSVKVPHLSKCLTSSISLTAELKQAWKKGSYVRMWAKITSLGINAAFDNPMQNTFNFRTELCLTSKGKVNIENICKLREKPYVNISAEEAEEFLKKWKTFQEFEHMASGNGEEQKMIGPPEKHIQHVFDYGEFPWLEFVDKLRQGGTNVALDFLARNPDVIQHVTKHDIHDTLGTEYEELQITQILAEAKAQNAPVSLIAGDGNGSFTFDGNPFSTDIDAVFRLDETGCFFAAKLDCHKNSVPAKKIVEEMINQATSADDPNLRRISEFHSNTTMFNKAVHCRQTNVNFLQSCLSNCRDGMEKMFQDPKAKHLVDKLRQRWAQFQKVRDKFGKDKSELHWLVAYDIGLVSLDLYNAIKDGKFFKEELLLELGLNSGINATIDAIITFAVVFPDELSQLVALPKPNEDAVSKEKKEDPETQKKIKHIAEKILETTSDDVTWGGTIGIAYTAFEMLVSYATVRGWRSVAIHTMGYSYHMQRKPINLVSELIFLEAFAATYPWVGYMVELRNALVEANKLRQEMVTKSSEKAIWETLDKRAEMIRNWPNPDEYSNLLGFAFEELQIGKVLYEARRRGVPLEVIAGDGKGKFIYNGVTHKTPEYTDVVFQNTETGEYFAVQFKFSKEPHYLKAMEENHYRKWSKDDNRLKVEQIKETFPEPMHLENVKLIGPQDVVSNIQGDNNFENEIRFGMEVRPDSYKTMVRFLEKHKEALIELASSNKCVEIKEIKKYIANQKRKLKRQKKKIERKQEEIEQVPNQKREVVERLQKQLKELENKKAEIEALIEKSEQQLTQYTEDLKAMVSEKVLEVKWERAKKWRQLKEAGKEIGTAAAAMALIEGVTTLVISSVEHIKRWKNGEETTGKMIQSIVKESAVATGKGALIGGGQALMECAAQRSMIPLLSTAGKLIGPLIFGGVLIYQAHGILKEWNEGNITTAEMKRSLTRAGTGAALSIGGMVAAGCLIGGPIGFLVACGIGIAVGLCDYFLGDKLFRLFWKDDPKEVVEILKKQYSELRHDVLKAAYGLFDLTEDATEEELRAAYKVAILKYHPDKGGDPEKFKAVHSAYIAIHTIGNHPDF